MAPNRSLDDVIAALGVEATAVIAAAGNLRSTAERLRELQTLVQHLRGAVGNGSVERERLRGELTDTRRLLAAAEYSAQGKGDEVARLVRSAVDERAAYQVELAELRRQLSAAEYAARTRDAELARVVGQRDSAVRERDALRADNVVLRAGLAVNGSGVD